MTCPRWLLLSSVWNRGPLAFCVRVNTALGGYHDPDMCLLGGGVYIKHCLFCSLIYLIQSVSSAVYR